MHCIIPHQFDLPELEVACAGCLFSFSQEVTYSGRESMKLSFIKLDIEIMNDTKIKIIRKMPDGDKLLVMWIGILCLGMKSGRAGVIEIGDGIPFTADTLSAELDININTIKLGLETFSKLKMIEFFDDQSIYITNFEKHQELEKIEIAKEKLRIRVKKHRERQKVEFAGNKPVTVTVTPSNAIELDKEQELELDKEQEQDQSENSFDLFWNTYDKKVDRSKSLSKWKKLTQVEKESALAAVPKYVQSTPDKQYRKHPVTYINNKSWENEIIVKQQASKPNKNAENYQKTKEMLGI